MTRLLGKNLPLTLFQQFWELMGRYCSSLLPRQDGRTSQIQINGRFLPSRCVTLCQEEANTDWTDCEWTLRTCACAQALSELSIGREARGRMQGGDGGVPPLPLSSQPGRENATPTAKSRFLLKTGKVLF